MPPPKKEESVDSDDEVMEKFDNFVPPSAPVRRPSSVKRASRARKRPASVHAVGSSSRINNASKATPAKKRKTEQKPKVVRNAPKMFIGIDFGTTYSGISYTCSGRQDGIRVVMNIDRSGKCYEKVPTAIQFSFDGDQYILAWGNHALSAPGTLKFFKLHILKDEDLRDEIRNCEPHKLAKALMEELGMSVIEAIAQYLKKLWESFINLAKETVTAQTVEMSRFYVVVTLPAIWPDYAKESMQQAVRMAGILDKRPGVSRTVLTFISEPEAAALATIKRIDENCEIESNDCFVVCDAGGGTADIISYKLNSTQPVKMQEIVAGTGALCGAIYVDEELIRLLKTRFAEISSIPWERMDPEELDHFMNMIWNSQRNTFSGQNSENWTVRLPYSLIPPGHTGIQPRVVITPEDMMQVFQPSVERIADMVGEQISAINENRGKPPRYIILVGGYGRCPYLRTRFNERFPGIEVLQSQDSEPWTAVSRGAVIHGLTSAGLDSEHTVEVESRIARASFGVVCQEDFDPEKHLDEDKVMDNDLGRFVVTKRMKWFITKGQDIQAGGKFTHSFFKTLDRPTTFRNIIWMCHRSRPPAHRDASVTKYSDVTWDPRIDFNNLPLVHGADGHSGKPARQLDYQAEMTWGNGVAEYAIIYEGKRQAAASVSVELLDHAEV